MSEVDVKDLIALIRQPYMQRKEWYSKEKHEMIKKALLMHYKKFSATYPADGNKLIQKRLKTDDKQGKLDVYEAPVSRITRKTRPRTGV